MRIRMDLDIDCTTSQLVAYLHALAECIEEDGLMSSPLLREGERVGNMVVDDD
jgi:hypothetical protein